jgi:hypothetical protein
MQEMQFVPAQEEDMEWAKFPQSKEMH